MSQAPFSSAAAAPVPAPLPQPPLPAPVPAPVPPPVQAQPYDFDDFTWPPTNPPPRVTFKKIGNRDFGATRITKRNNNHALYHHKIACNGAKSLPKNEPYRNFLLVSNPETGRRLPRSPKNRIEVLSIPNRHAWYPILNMLGKEFAEDNDLCRNTCRRIYVDFHNVTRILHDNEMEPSNA